MKNSHSQPSITNSVQSWQQRTSVNFNRFLSVQKYKSKGQQHDKEKITFPQIREIKNQDNVEKKQFLKLRVNRSKLSGLNPNKYFTIDQKMIQHIKNNFKVEPTCKVLHENSKRFEIERAPLETKVKNKKINYVKKNIQEKLEFPVELKAWAGKEVVPYSTFFQSLFV